MEQDTQVQDTQTTDATPEATAKAPVGLTLQDLRVLAGSVELGAQRGAFRAGEMEVIGATYNKLATFLAANTPAEAPAEAPAEGTTDTSTEVTETADSAE